MEYYKRFEPADEYLLHVAVDYPELGEAFRAWRFPSTFHLVGDPISKLDGVRYLIPAEATPLLVLPALRFTTTSSGGEPPGLLSTSFADVYLATRYVKPLPRLAEVNERWASEFWKRSRHYFEEDRIEGDYLEDNETYGEVFCEACRAADTITACGLDFCGLPMTFYVMRPEPFITDVYAEIAPKLPTPKIRHSELLYPMLSLFYRRWSQEPSSSFNAWATELWDKRICRISEDRLRQILIDAGIHTPRPRQQKTNQKKNARPRNTT